MAAKKKNLRRTWGTLRDLPSGNIRASYTADDGLVYYATRSFSTKMDAEAWLADERKLLDRGEWTPPRDRAAVKSFAGLTVREYAEKWMDPDYRMQKLPDRELRAKTHALYTRLLDTRILPGLGDEPLRAITPEKVNAWWFSLGKNTPTTNTQSYQLLKAIYNTAVKEKAAMQNPCQNDKAGKPPKPRDVKPLTPAELVKVAESVPETYRAAVAVAAWCGLRFGELIELRRKDIHSDGERMTLKIRRAATVVHDKQAKVHNTLVVGPPKTDAGMRSVTVPPHVAEILRAHMKAYTGKGPESFVFTTTKGLRLSQTAFTKTLKNGYASVGKPDMRVHDLRHVGATLAAQAGATTKELMSRIGHTTPAMAMRYQIAAQERDAAIADKLSELAGKG
jgi:integrase